MKTKQVRIRYLQLSAFMVLIGSSVADAKICSNMFPSASTVSVSVQEKGGYSTYRYQEIAILREGREPLAVRIDRLDLGSAFQELGINLAGNYGELPRAKQAMGRFLAELTEGYIRSGGKVEVETAKSEDNGQVYAQFTRATLLNIAKTYKGEPLVGLESRVDGSPNLVVLRPGRSPIVASLWGASLENAFASKGLTLSGSRGGQPAEVRLALEALLAKLAVDYVKSGGEIQTTPQKIPSEREPVEILTPDTILGIVNRYRGEPFVNVRTRYASSRRDWPYAEFTIIGTGLKPQSVAVFGQRLAFALQKEGIDIVLSKYNAQGFDQAMHELLAKATEAYIASGGKVGTSSDTLIASGDEVRILSDATIRGIAREYAKILRAK